MSLTPTTNDKFIPEITANVAIGRLTAYLSMGRTVTKDSQLTAAKYGDVISVPKRGAVSANQKTAGSSVTKQSPSATNVSVTLDQHWEVTIAEDDITEALAIETATLTGSGPASGASKSALPGYIEDSVIALAEKIETKLLDLHVSVPSTITGANPVTLANLAAGRERLIMNNVPKLARLFAQLHPTVITDLLATTPFSDPKFAQNNEGLTEGAIMRLYGFDIFENQLVPTTGSPVAWHNMLYHPNAFVLASRGLRLPDAGVGATGANVMSDAGISLRVVRSWDADNLAMQFTVDTLFGVAVLDNRLAVELDSF